MTKRGNAKNTSTMMETKRRKTREENEMTKRRKKEKKQPLKKCTFVWKTVLQNNKTQ